MRYYLIRDNVIENLVKWDGETPFDPGPNTRLIPEDELPEGLKLGDRIEPEEVSDDLEDDDGDDAIDFGDEEDDEGDDTDEDDMEES